MSINDRYQNVLVLAEDRHSRLKEAITLHQFFRDIADEESWIKEKKLLVGSDDYGRDLTGVQNLKKKHKLWIECFAGFSAGVEMQCVKRHLVGADLRIDDGR